MKKHTKKILGIVGLFVVGAMTAVAVGLPGPDANAVEETTSGTNVSVSVTSGPTKVEVTGEEPNGDPVVRMSYNNAVCRIELQATNIASGENVFHPPISYTVPTPRPADNTSVTVLPFTDNGAVAGDYTITANSYSCSQPEQTLGTSIARYTYKGTNSPAVPNTGELNLFGVNLARADYLAIGGLILAAALACVILAIRKKNEHHKK